MPRPLLVHTPCRNQDGGCPRIPKHCAHCSHPWPCPAVAHLVKTAGSSDYPPAVPNGENAGSPRSTDGEPDA